MSKKKGMIVSSYFNPIDNGHIQYFNNAKALADELFVIVNNDNQRGLNGYKIAFKYNVSEFSNSYAFTIRNKDL